MKLKTGEETDKLRDLQIQGVEIENMTALQKLGFEITRTHTGEFKVSKDPVISPTDMIEAEGQTTKETGWTRYEVLVHLKKNKQRFEGRTKTTQDHQEKVV